MDSKKDTAMNNTQIRREKSVPSQSHLSFTSPDLPPPDVVDGSEVAQTHKGVPTDRRTTRASILRHVRSASNLSRSVRGERAERMPENPAVPNAEARGGRSTTQAERPHVKGWWDSALDFVNPEGMIGFGAGSFYG